MKYLIHKFIKKNVHQKINYYVKLFYNKFQCNIQISK